MAVDVYTSIKELIQNILGNKDAAFQFASDPDGTLAAQGITDGDLSQVDIRQLVSECAPGADLPEGARQALQGYSSGGSAPSSYPVSTPPPGAPQSAAEVVQHLNYVTYATYEGDEQITQQLINYEDYSIDNSVDVDVDGDVHGDFNVDTTNVNATGDGAVAAGDDVENAATGDGSQIIDGDNYGNANTGDGAVQADGNINAPVNTGELTGIQADGDVSENVVGDGNETANIDLGAGGGGGGEVQPILLGARDPGGADAGPININFGGGTQQNVQDSEVHDSALAGGGDATNVTDIYEGSAVSTGEGDATGDNEESHVDAHDSTVATEQGVGDQTADQQLDEETEDVGSL